MRLFLRKKEKGRDEGLSSFFAHFNYFDSSFDKKFHIKMSIDFRSVLPDFDKKFHSGRL